MSKRKSRPKPSARPPAVQPVVPLAVQSGPLPAAVGIVAVSIAVTLAVVLRFWASLDNFWLDEIWSWIMAGKLQSPLEVVTSVHHDNNHYLNTLVLYVLGGDAPTYLYRLPAVLAGIGAVLLSGWVARRWSSLAGVTATLLTGCSFLMIQYSSEARGYAYLLFFTMASFAAMQESFERPRAIWDVLFAGCAILGLLSHLTYLFAYVALIAWSLWRRIHRDGWQTRRHIVPFICQILIPGGFAAFLYLVDLRYIQMGGGDKNSAWGILAQAISAAFGGPLEGSATVWIAVAVALVGIVALFLLYRSGSDLWVPMAVGIFIVPLIVCLIAQPRAPYPRYFLVSMLLLQLLISWFLGWLYQRRYGKVAYVIVLVAILGGNAVLTTRLLTYGRGGYEAAVRYMLDQTFSQDVSIGSDHDFRNRTLLDFYFTRARIVDRAEYFEIGKWPPRGPEWFVSHASTQQYVPDRYVTDDQGHIYELARVFPFAGLSGFHWALYHNTNRPTNAPL
jgi:hypothetical protein